MNGVVEKVVSMDWIGIGANVIFYIVTGFLMYAVWVSSADIIKALAKDIFGKKK